MPTRRYMLWAAPAAVLGLGLGASGWVLLRPSGATGIGGPFSLIDGNGRAVTEAALRGRWTLVYFGYTHCPDACPTALADMAGALDLLDPVQRRDVSLLFVTVDPARDTPAVLKDYVGNFDAPITGLSGSAEQVAAAARSFRVYYAKHPTADGYDMDHSSVIYLMDPDGRLAATFTHETPAAQMAETLRAAMSSRGR